MKAKGGSWSNKGGGKGPKGQGSLHSGQQINNGQWKGGSPVWESKGGAWDHVAKGGVWGGGQGKGHPGKGGTNWFDGVSGRVVCRTVEHGKQYLRTLGHPSFS